jgi:hypothetical protein
VGSEKRALLSTWAGLRGGALWPLSVRQHLTGLHGALAACRRQMGLSHTQLPCNAQDVHQHREGTGSTQEGSVGAHGGSRYLPSRGSGSESLAAAG